MTSTILISSNKTIEDVYVADTFLKRLRGYMFREKPHYKAITIIPCNSIHTFFMRFRIDVLFISKENKVVKKINNISKGKVILPINNSYYVIEAMEGVLDDINVGDIISFQNY